MSLLQVRDVPDGELHRIEDLAETLAHAVDVKGKYDPSHSVGVARLAHALGHHLGVSGPALFRLRVAGLLHDVGKLAIHDDILLKPGALTPSEYDAIKTHPVRAHDMLIALGLPDEARWVLHHHERCDGGGYPTGLSGNGIPVASRILAVADAYDVMVTRRVYSEPMSHQAAVVELRRCANAQFDADVVEALASILAIGRSLASRAGRIPSPDPPSG